MRGILGLVILVLNILATLKLLKAKADDTKKLLWILVVWLLPGLGVLLYYLIPGPGAKGKG